MADPLTPDRVPAVIARLRATLNTLIRWIAQSAGSPISHQEAVMLLEMLDGSR